MHEIRCLKVLEFRNDENSNHTNFAILKNDGIIELQNNITICSTHKQDRVDTIHSRCIYVIYKDDSYQIPWFTIGFWSLGRLWANVANKDWYILGNATTEQFLDWMHICVEIDLSKKTLKATIQQKLFPTVFNVSGLTPGLKLNNFKLGVVHHSNELNEIVQFSGSVTNINVFRAKDKTLLKRQAEEPCSFSSKEAILSWQSMKWKITENVLQTTMHKHTLCSVKDYINLRLPFLWRKDNAKDFCRKLGDGKVSEFNDPSNLSNLNMDEMYGNRYSECENFWTPYSDENEEGVFVNENSEEVVR